MTITYTVLGGTSSNPNNINDGNNATQTNFGALNQSIFIDLGASRTLSSIDLPLVAGVAGTQEVAVLPCDSGGTPTGAAFYTITAASGGTHAISGTSRYLLLKCTTFTGGDMGIGEVIFTASRSGSIRIGLAVGDVEDHSFDDDAEVTEGGSDGYSCGTYSVGYYRHTLIRILKPANTGFITTATGIWNKGGETIGRAALINQILGLTDALSTATGGTAWLHGTGAPDDEDGADGDFYLNDANGDYYQKAAGEWGSAIAVLGGGDTFDPDTILTADGEVLVDGDGNVMIGVI